MDDVLFKVPVRRRRVRQQRSLVERLQQRAEEARQLATKTSCSVERAMLLQRADQADTAAEFATDLLPMHSLGVFRGAGAK